MMKFIGKSILITGNKEKVLVFGDLHIGYEEALHRAGISIGNSVFKETLEDFQKIFEKTGRVGKVIFLGDIKHQFSENLNQEWREIKNLLDFVKKYCDKIVIIKGNHDNYVKNIVNKLDYVEVKDFYLFEDCAFLHGDRDFEEIWDKKIKKIIIGHLHPAITLTDGTKSEKYKCFLVGDYKKKEFVVIPSFFEGFVGTDVREKMVDMPWQIDFGRFNVWVVQELNALDFGRLNKIKD